MLHSQRTELAGAIAGSIAHELSNMLTVIAGCLDFIDQDMERDALARYTEHARKATERASALTLELLGLTKRGSRRLVPADLNTILNDMYRIIRRVLGEEAGLAMDLDADLPPVRVDHAEFRQAMLNVVLNAREAMGAGGLLTIETSVEHDTVVVRVTDTGAGMDEPTRHRALEPFFTTKTDGKGIGLAVVRFIMERAGGEVVMAGAVGEGTTVELRLPAI
jgi:two-component system cell cycle sensor histidine kinase/response regulator CckA